MTNAEKFLETFGIYASELWAMPENMFLSWLNSEADGRHPCDYCQEFVCEGCLYKNGVRRNHGD